MRAYYSDTFVLPLPEHHRFPMAKYRLLRERLVVDGVLSPADLQLPDPIAWEDLRLVHTEAVCRGSAARNPLRQTPSDESVFRGRR